MRPTAFLRPAQPQLSAELKNGVGAHLFDGAPTMTYDDRLDDVRQVLRIIDEGQ
ncbi:MAG: hypothetical protein H0T04_06570 [Chloroflexi bacterium]|jgi:hypothetical protein|nr:hypothetical protein [Chloroflexota bacterium]